MRRQLTSTSAVKRRGAYISEMRSQMSTTQGESRYAENTGAAAVVHKHACMRKLGTVPACDRAIA